MRQPMRLRRICRYDEPMTSEVIHRGRSYPLSQAVFVVGSHPTCDLRIEGEGVDAAHLAFLLGASGGVWIAPLTSGERAVSLEGSAQAVAWTDQDATVEVAGEVLELRVRGEAWQPPEAGLAPAEAEGEMARLWEIWEGERKPGDDRYADARGWAFRDARYAFDALMDLAERPPGDELANLAHALRAWVGPVRVEAYQTRSPPGEVPLDVAFLGPGDPPESIDHRLRGLLRLAFEAEEPRYAEDVAVDPRLHEPVLRNVRSAMAGPLGPSTEDPILVLVWRRIQEEVFEPQERLAFAMLLAVSGIRRGTWRALWSPPLLPALGPLLCTPGRRPFLLQKEFTILGRDPRLADVLLGEEDCSRRHAGILRAPDGRTFVIDLGSSQGTFVNGDLAVAERLFDGDELRFGGKSSFRYHHDRLGASLAVAARDLLTRGLEWCAQGCMGKPPAPGS